MSDIGNILGKAIGPLLVVSLLLTTARVTSADTDLNFSYRAVSVEDAGDFPREIEQASRAMYRVWQRWLGHDRLRSARVELLLLGSPLEFEQLKQRMAPELPPVSGFYATATDQAVVYYDPATPDNNRFTALHEVAHLISYSQVGPLARWLAEGLAEYFETLVLEEDGVYVLPNLRYQAVLGRQPLIEFMSLPVTAWQGEAVEQYYAAAWSLVYFLRDSPRGRVALREVLVRMTSPLRRQLSEQQLLDLSYPGGLVALEADWHAWLDKNEFYPQRLL